MDNTEVRIPLYDGPWDNLLDVQKTLNHVVEELRLEQECIPGKKDMIFIEIEWELAARENKNFIEALQHYSPSQFWLRFERM